MKGILVVTVIVRQYYPGYATVGASKQSCTQLQGSGYKTANEAKGDVPTTHIHYLVFVLGMHALVGSSLLVLLRAPPLHSITTISTIAVSFR